MSDRQQVEAELSQSDIIGDCHRCGLVVYRSDPRRKVGIPPGSPPQLYHSGCALATDGEFLEAELKKDCNKLRSCGYIVELRIVRPVR